jgi:hypothetical protein
VLPSDTVLCIAGRFAVEATWETASGRAGAPHAVDLTDESGYFWFFDPGNVELLVKTLNACGIGQGNWFFGAGMTTVGVHTRVTDTFTGEVRTYDNPVGAPFVPIQDTRGFAFCPTATPTPTPTSTPSPFPTSATATSTPARVGRTYRVGVYARCDFGCTYSFSPGEILVRSERVSIGVGRAAPFTRRPRARAPRTAGPTEAGTPDQSTDRDSNTSSSGPGPSPTTAGSITRSIFLHHHTGIIVVDP